MSVVLLLLYIAYEYLGTGASAAAVMRNLRIDDNRQRWFRGRWVCAFCWGVATRWCWCTR